MNTSQLPSKSNFSGKAYGKLSSVQLYMGENSKNHSLSLSLLL